MKPKNSVLLVLALAAVPWRGSVAAGSDQDFFQQLKGIRRDLVWRGSRSDLKARPVTQESGPDDPLLLMQAPLINLVKKVRPSIALLSVQHALCTGFFVDVSKILDRNTLIVTNSHCVENSKVGDEVKLGLYNGNDNHVKDATGKILAFGSSDHAKDIAFVELMEQSLSRPGLPLWFKLDVGEQVVAIGHPHGFTFSVSQGIVSALGRERLDTQFVMDMTQTDAAMNPGNSGGPLFNLWGSVVGINSMIYSEGNAHGFEGLAFALPAQYIIEALRQYRRTGNLDAGSMMMLLKADNAAGKLTVENVDSNGPSHAAGIRPKDEILRIDQLNFEAMSAMDKMNRLIAHVKYMSPGEKTSVTLLREGREMTVEVTLRKAGTERPDWAPIPPDPTPKQRPPKPKKTADSIEM